jgi:hypothetical protein
VVFSSDSVKIPEHFKLWHNHCDPTIVTQPLWPNHCDPTIVTQPLWRNHCDPTIVTQPLWPNHCDTTIVTQPLWPNHCDTTIVTQPLSYTPFIINCSLLSYIRCFLSYTHHRQITIPNWCKSRTKFWVAIKTGQYFDVTRWINPREP